MKKFLLLFSYLSVFQLYSQENVLADNVLTNNAVVLVYHHVSTSTPASTSVTPERFNEHMDYLNQHFHVEKLSTIIRKLQTNQPLTPNTVAITFDDGYNNILTNAHPILKKLKLPYTVFINPSRIDKETGQLSWQQVQLMHNQGVTFANHTLDHLHLLDRLEGESQDQWLNRVWGNIISAQLQLEQRLPSVPRWLAYPFGEYNLVLADKLKEENIIGFAQHSGAISSYSDFSALPRFPAAGIYGNLNTLKVKMGSIAMPVTSIAAKDPEQVQGSTIGFSVSLTKTEQFEDIRVQQIQCFYQGKLIAHTIKDNTLTVDSEILVPTGRSRVNCTAPSGNLKGRYYWYSQPFFLSNVEGKYPN